MRKYFIEDKGNGSYKLTIAKDRTSIKKKKDWNEEEFKRVNEFFLYVENKILLNNISSTMRGKISKDIISGEPLSIIMWNDSKTIGYTFDEERKPIKMPIIKSLEYMQQMAIGRPDFWNDEKGN